MGAVTRRVTGARSGARARAAQPVARSPLTRARSGGPARGSPGSTGVSAARGSYEPPGGRAQSQVVDFGRRSGRRR
eukprot:11216545-Lingulodinium_polyedra.AAC.1